MRTIDPSKIILWHPDFESYLEHCHLEYFHFVWARPMRRHTIRTVWTNRKEIWRSIYGRKIASHYGYLNYFNVSSEREGETVWQSVQFVQIQHFLDSKRYSRFSLLWKYHNLSLRLNFFTANSQISTISPLKHSLEVILLIYRRKKVCFPSKNGILESWKFTCKNRGCHFDWDLIFCAKLRQKLCF